MTEKLGYEADVNVSKAIAAVKAFEASLHSLHATVGQVNQKSPVGDPKSMQTAHRTMAQALRDVERQGVGTFRKLNQQAQIFDATMNQGAKTLRINMVQGFTSANRSAQQLHTTVAAIAGLYGHMGATRLGGGPHVPGAMGGGLGGPPGGPYGASPANGGRGAPLQAMHVQTMHVQTLHVQHQQGQQNGGRTAAGGGIMGSLSGLAGMIGLGGVVSYVVGAVRDQADEYTREASLGSRLSGRGSVDRFAAGVHEAGRSQLFGREESMQLAEAIGTRMADNRGVNMADVSQGARMARGFGMDPSAMGTVLGNAGQSGVARAGDMRRFGGELAAAVDKSNMLGRAAEAMEASVSILTHMSDEIGNLSDEQRRSYLAVQARFAGSGEEMFRGNKGAQFLQGLGQAIRGGGSETGDVLTSRYLVQGAKKRGEGMSYVDLLMKREQGASQENLQDIGAGVRADFGRGMGNGKPLRDRLIEALMNAGYAKSATQGDAILKATGAGSGKSPDYTKALTNFGDKKAIDAATGNAVIDAGLNKQKSAFNGAADAAHRVKLMEEDLSRYIGSALLPTFKTLQEKAYSFALFTGKTVIPGIQHLGENAWAYGQKLLDMAKELDISKLGDTLKKLGQFADDPVGYAASASRKAAGDAAGGAAGSLLDAGVRILNPNASVGPSGQAPNMTVSGNESDAQRFAAFMRKFEGQAYMTGGGHGGLSKIPIPVDCSGLIDQAAQAIGKKDLFEAGTANIQGNKGVPIDLSRPKQFKVGDLLYRLQRGMHQGATKVDDEGYGLIGGKRFFGHVGAVTGFDNKGRPMVTQAGSSKGQVYTAPYREGFWDEGRDNFNRQGPKAIPADLLKPGITPGLKDPALLNPDRPGIYKDPSLLDQSRPGPTNGVRPDPVPVSSRGPMTVAVSVQQVWQVNGGNLDEVRQVSREAAEASHREAAAKIASLYTFG